MEIILSKQCESLTGSFGRGFGYHIQKRKNGFFAKRNSKGIIPPDGHWRFILACAELAQSKLHIADIRVTRLELKTALMEAGQYPASLRITQTELNAEQVINFKQKHNL